MNPFSAAVESVSVVLVCAASVFGQTAQPAAPSASPSSPPSAAQPAAPSTQTPPSAPSAQTPPSAPASETAAPPASTPASQPAGPSATSRPDAAVATVNGDKIMESEIDAVFNAWKENNPHAQGMGAEQLDQMRKHFSPQILQMLVNAKLLDAEVAKAGLKITDEGLAKKLEGDVQRHLLMRGMTREELDEQIHSQTNRHLKEVLDEQLADPRFRQNVLQTMLIEQKFPDKVQVTDQEVEADYERDFEMMYQRPAQVRASHILVDTQKAKTDEEKAAAKKKIEEILVEVKKPGADFADLAKKHSDCPSSAKGGDLGFFPREGMMAEPFAAAAFGLEVGQISDVVETPFGYHIIKVTAKKPAMVTTLDQAREAIRQQIKERKAAELMEQFVSDLEKAAKIEYAEQSGLKPPSASQPAAPEQATNKPAAAPGAPAPATTQPSAGAVQP